jgi:hypothetical protein
MEMMRFGEQKGAENSVRCAALLVPSRSGYRWRQFAGIHKEQKGYAAGPSGAKGCARTSVVPPECVS